MENRDYFNVGTVYELCPEAGPWHPGNDNMDPDKFLHFAPDFIYRAAHIPGITADQAVQLGIEYLRIARATDLNLPTEPAT